MWAIDAEYAADDFLDDFDENDDGEINMQEWMLYSENKLQELIRAENKKIVKEMDKYKIPASKDFNPTSHYY